MSKQELIERAKQKDKEAFATLFQMHYLFLYRYLLKLTLHHETTEDIIQETMMKCFLHINKYNASSSFSSWLITIATRTYFDILRKKKHEREWINHQMEAGKHQLSWQLQSINERWSDMMESFSELKPDVRCALLLKHYYDYSYDEIAQMTGEKCGTIKSRVHYGIAHVRKELTHDE